MAAGIHTGRDNGRIVLYKSADSRLIKNVGGKILNYNIIWVALCCEPIDDDFIDQLQIANAVQIPKPSQNNDWNSDLGRKLLKKLLSGWTPALLPVEAEEAPGRALPSDHHRFIHFLASDQKHRRQQNGEPPDNVRVAANAATNNYVWGTMESFPNGAICRLYPQPDLPPRQPLPGPRRRPNDYDDDDLESRLEWTVQLLELQKSQLKTIRYGQPGRNADRVPIHSSLLPGRRYEQVQYGDTTICSICDLFARALDLGDLGHKPRRAAVTQGFGFFRGFVNVPCNPSTNYDHYRVENNNCIDYAIRCWNLLKPRQSEGPIVLDYKDVHRHDGFYF